MSTVFHNEITVTVRFKIEVPFIADIKNNKQMKESANTSVELIRVKLSDALKELKEAYDVNVLAEGNR